MATLSEISARITVGSSSRPGPCCQEFTEEESLLGHFKKAHQADVAVYEYEGMKTWTSRNSVTRKFHCPFGGCKSSEKTGMEHKKKLIFHIKNAHSGTLEGNQGQGRAERKRVVGDQTSRSEEGESMQTGVMDNTLQGGTGDIGMVIDEDMNKVRQKETGGNEGDAAITPREQMTSQQLMKHGFTRIPAFDVYGVVYYAEPQASLLFCETCRIFLPATSVTKHALAKHGIQHDGAEESQFWSACKAYQQPSRAKEYPTPPPRSKPLPFIQRLRGYKCLQSACGQLFVEKKYILEHVRGKHRTEYLKRGNHSYQSNVPMQRLFEKDDFPITRYFEINEVLDGSAVSLDDSQLNASLQVIIGNILPNIPASGRRGVIDHQQDTAFHQQFRWPHLLKAQLDDHTGEQLQLVAQLKRELADKTNPMMRDLQDMLVHMMEKAKKIIKDADFANRFTGHILHGENYKARTGMKTFKPVALESSIQGYGRKNAAFISLILAFAAAPSLVNKIRYQMPFSEIQKAGAEQLMTDLKMREANKVEEEATDLKPLVAFLKAIFQGSEDGLRSLFMSVMAIHALKEDGSFIPPTTVTPELAAIHYLGHSFVIVCAHMDLEASGSKMSLMNYQEAINVAHAHIHPHNMQSYMGDVDDLQGFATSWVNQNPKLPNIIWGDDSEWLSYEGKTVWMDRLSKGLKAVIQECKDILFKLVGDHNFEVDLPERVEDNVTKTEMNYCAFDQHPPTVVRFFELVIKHQQRPLTVGNKMDQEIVAELLEDIGRLNSKLLLLTYWTGAITIRGTEITGLLARNTSQPRNFYVEDGNDGPRCFLTQSYSKTSNSSGRAELRVHYPAPEVQKLLMIFLYCIRPAEIVMVQQHMSSDEQDITSRYLFVHQGKKTVSQDLSRLLQDFMNTHCGVNVGLGGSRQIAISISHRFMKVSLIFEDETEDQLDTFAGHSTEVTRSNYARVVNTLRQQKDMSRDRLMNEEWWRVLGLTDEEPVLARIRRKNPGPIKEAVSTSQIFITDDGETMDQDPKSGGDESETFEMEAPYQFSESTHPLTAAQVASTSGMIYRSDEEMTMHTDIKMSEPGPSHWGDGVQDYDILQVDDGFEREFDEHNFDNAKEQKILIEHEDDTDSEDDRMQLESQVRLQIRRLYNDPEGGERSKQQMEAVILSQQAKEDLVVILPTGAGKSLIWNVLAKLNPRETTLVVVPFRALLEQHLEFSRSKDIQAEHFQMSDASDCNNPAFMVQILFCVPESLTNLSKVDQFMNTPVGLRITRVVIDEAHTLYIDPIRARANETVVPLQEAITIRPCPLIFLTATLSPKHEEHFMTEARLQATTKVIRMNSDRQNLALYTMKPKSSQSGGEMVRTLIWNLKFHLETQAERGNHELAIVFGVSRDEVESIGADCDILAYHARLGKETRSQILSEWGTGTKRILVTTTALSTGIDKANLRYCVIHGAIFGLYNQVQSLGRAGRDGVTSYIINIYDDRVMHNLNSNDLSSVQMDSMNDMAEYLEHQGCLRGFISNVMDNKAISCIPQSDSACSSRGCRAQQKLAQIRRWCSIAHPEAKLSAADQEKIWSPLPLKGLSKITQSTSEGAQVGEKRSLEDTPTKPKGAAAKRGKTGEGSTSTKVDAMPPIPRVGRMSGVMQPGNYRQHKTYSGTRLIQPKSNPLQSGVQNRAQESQETLSRMSEHLCLLNTILLRLKGHCPSCFVLCREFNHRHPNDICPNQKRALVTSHLSFKAFFRWENYEACRSCGCCQERLSNGRYTRAHELMGYPGPKSPCTWDGLLYQIIWIFWCVPQYREPMLSYCGLGQNTTLQELQVYLQAMKVGKLTKFHEVFIWCCYMVQPDMFGMILENKRTYTRGEGLLSVDIELARELNKRSKDDSTVFN